MHLGKFQTSGFGDSCRTAWGVGSLLTWPSFLLPRLGPGRRHHAERAWARSVARLLRVDLAVTGLEHIESDRSYVVAPLHEGFFDVPVLLHLPLDLAWVARKELEDWRVLGRYLRATEQIVISNDARPSEITGLVERARRIQERGESLVVFPQGTILGLEIAFARGAFWLADVLESPVLPIALSGTHRVWEHPHSPRLRFDQRVSMEVLPPLAPGRAQQSMERVQRQLKDTALALDAPTRRFDPRQDGYWDGYRYEIDPRFPDTATRVEAHRSAVSDPV